MSKKFFSKTIKNIKSFFSNLCIYLRNREFKIQKRLVSTCIDLNFSFKYKQQKAALHVLKFCLCNLLFSCKTT